MRKRIVAKVGNSYTWFINGNTLDCRRKNLRKLRKIDILMAPDLYQVDDLTDLED